MHGLVAACANENKNTFFMQMQGVTPLGNMCKTLCIKVLLQQVSLCLQRGEYLTPRKDGFDKKNAHPQKRYTQQQNGSSFRGSTTLDITTY